MARRTLAHPQHRSLKVPELPPEFYKVIVEHMSEGLWVGDKDHNTRYINPTFERIFGYTKQEWSRMHSYDFFDKKNREMIERENARRIKGKASKYEISVCAKDGRNIPVLMSGAPLPDGGTVGIMTDLRKLKETEEQYHRLVESMNEGVWVGNAQHHTMYANPAFLEMAGYTLDEVLGKDGDMFLAPELLHTLKGQNVRHGKYEQSHYETIFVSKEGTRIPVMVHAVPFIDGNLATITDLRSLKRLEKSEREFQALAKYSIDAMVSLDEHDVVRAWNVGAERMFGWTAEEIIGKPITPLIPKEKIEVGELGYLLNEANAKGFVRNHETVRLHKNGKPINVSLTYTAIQDTHDRHIGYSAVYRDITMQKQWERDLQARFDKMQDAYMEMGKLRRYVDYLVDLLDLGTGVWEGSNIYQFIVNAMMMFSKADAVILRRYEKAKEKLVLVANTGTAKDWHTKGAISVNGSLAEQAFLTKKPIKVIDVTQEPRYRTPGLARKNNLRSLLLIPMIVREEKIGTISVYISTENRIDVLDHEFIPLFARQAAIVLKLIAQLSTTKSYTKTLHE